MSGQNASAAMLWNQGPLTFPSTSTVSTLMFSRNTFAAFIASEEERELFLISWLYVGKYPTSSRVGSPSIICANVRSARSVDRMFCRS